MSWVEWRAMLDVWGVVVSVTLLVVGIALAIWVEARDDAERRRRAGGER